MYCTPRPLAIVYNRFSTCKRLRLAAKWADEMCPRDQKGQMILIPSPRPGLHRCMDAVTIGKRYGVYICTPFCMVLILSTGEFPYRGYTRGHINWSLACPLGIIQPRDCFETGLSLESWVDRSGLSISMDRIEDKTSQNWKTSRSKTERYELDKC